MIAQCTQCGQTFNTERFGAQACPSCGTQVYIEAPGAEPGAAPPASSGWTAVPPLEGATEDLPWERRRELGFFRAWFETWKASLFRPTEFFGRMRTDHVEGAFLYGWLTYTVAGIASVLWAWLLMGVSMQMMAGMEELQSDPQAQEVMRLVGIFLGPIGILAMPILAAIGIYVYAGLLHVGVMIFGANNRSWNATFRAVNYTQGVQLFNVLPFAVIPFIGGLFSMALAGWLLVLTIIALMHTQKTTAGRAVGAVFFWPVVACCCGLAAALIGAGLVASAAGGMQ